MRIAIFTEVFLPKIDGVVTRVVRTLDELAELGHEAIVFAPGSPPPSYKGFKVVRVRSFSFRPWYPEIKVGLPTPNIARKMVKFAPDVWCAICKAKGYTSPSQLSHPAEQLYGEAKSKFSDEHRNQVDEVSSQQGSS